MFPIDLTGIVVILVLTAGGLLSVITHKLTVVAGLTGIIAGLLVYNGAGLTGLTELAAFFILAAIATGHKKKLKAAFIQHSCHQEQRNTGQVLANGGIPALIGLLPIVFPEQQGLAQLMIAGALSAATADTLASELGMVYGKSFVNILTFKHEPRGLDGVISIEGLLFGMAGSTFIGIIYAIGYCSAGSIWTVLIAGTVGNLTDSYLGATLERRGLLKNNMVNMSNTLAGALTAFLAALIINGCCL